MKHTIHKWGVDISSIHEVIGPQYTSIKPVGTKSQVCQRKYFWGSPNGVKQNYIVIFPTQMSPIFMYNICICQSEAKYGREGMEMCYTELGLNLQLGSST